MNVPVKPALYRALTSMGGPAVVDPAIARFIRLTSLSFDQTTPTPKKK